MKNVQMTVNENKDRIEVTVNREANGFVSVAQLLMNKFDFGYDAKKDVYTKQNNRKWRLETIDIVKKCNSVLDQYN